MKKTVIAFMSLSVVAAMFLQACNKDDDDDTPKKTNEFIADDNSFAGFESWSLDATRMGPDPALGGFAHGGNDSTVTRNIYFMNGVAAGSNGEYAVGSLIAKRSTSPNGLDEITGMAKRGNDYDPGGNDWEYFMLNADGSIAKDTTGAELRGSMLFGGACQGCHEKATTDYIFTK